jgi:hypothetical protein
MFNVYFGFRRQDRHRLFHVNYALWNSEANLKLSSILPKQFAHCHFEPSFARDCGDQLIQ